MSDNVPHGNISVNLDLPCGHGLVLPVGKNAGMKNRIKEFREARGFTQGQLAERAGVDTSYISRLETGKRGRGKGGKGGPTYAILAAISAALVIPIGELIDPDEAALVDSLDDDTHLIPVLSKISAGTFRAHDGVREADIERHIRVSHLSRGDWFALEVDGDSMDLVAPPGAVLIVNRADHALIDGKHYVFSLDDGAATFKQYRGEPEPMLVPQSTNRNHYAVPVGERELYVFGRVRRVITDL